MDEVIKLLVAVEDKTEMGGRIANIISENEIFASKLSVRASEFYQAHQSGIEVTKIFRVWANDYNDERIIEHEGKYYTIVRSYEKGDFIELSVKTRKGLFEEVVR